MRRKNNIIKGILAVMLGIAIFSSTGIIARAAYSDQVTLSINKPGAASVMATSGLNVRNTASTDGNIVGFLPYGTNIMIIERLSNGWDKVQYDVYGNVGYVDRNYLFEYSLSHYLTVSTGGDPLYFREGDGSGYGIIGSIPNGRSLPELINLDTWSHGIWGNKEGYVCNRNGNTYYTIRTHY